jgi:hypothetical protein
MRKNIRNTFITILIVCALLMANCKDWTPGQYQNIEYNLRGTWARTDDWTGYLEIGYNYVIISGYVNHLFYFTHNIPLEAYTEDGYLYIKDIGEWQEPVAYVRWRSAYVPEYGYIQMLTLKSDDLLEDTFELIE